MHLTETSNSNSNENNDEVQQYSIEVREHTESILTTTDPVSENNHSLPLTIKSDHEPSANEDLASSVERELSLINPVSSDIAILMLIHFSLISLNSKLEF